MTATDGIEIRPLTGETWTALAELFREGGDPGWCWYNRQVVITRQRGPLDDRRRIREAVAPG
jgi:hypothetical protein